MSITKNKNQPKVKDAIYETYLNQEEIEKGLGNFIKGSLRLNSRNYKEAYVTHHKLDSDIFIYDKDINRALFDDIVAIKIHSKYDWKVLNELSSVVKNVSNKVYDNNNLFITIRMLLKDSPNFFKENLQWNVTRQDLENSNDFSEQCDKWWKYFQRTGKVVGIVKQMNTRHCVGTLSVQEDSEKSKSLKFIKFSPTDCRFPRIVIPIESCPTDFLKRPFDYKDVRFITKICDWNEMNLHPIGEISQCLKNLPLIEQETLRILAESGFINEEFDDNVRSSIPKDVMTEDDLKYRRDLRSECVISIDPKTARDLDDAMHIKRLPGMSSNNKPLWEVGVHIADVTYYVTPGTEIDKEANNRTTTVYLVHKAIPMLPRELCEELCSLNPGTDKLTYSVIYKVTDDCEIIDTWIGRTIINTASKLSYEEAQTVLDNPTKPEWQAGDFNEIFPPFTANDVSQCILNLNHLAVQMRQNRYNAGSLFINQPKIGFVLNTERTIPIGFKQYKLSSSNHLIEEWMLRANISVAEFLHLNLPNKAFLRCHPPPTAQAINGLNKQFKQMGWQHMCLETGSTYEFQDLVSSDNESLNQAVMLNMCSKLMQLAVYFCHDGDQSAAGLARCHHFALNVPLYTHFTSPIRRYPDMVVHRQLTEILIAKEQQNTLSGDHNAKINWMARTTQSKDLSQGMLNDTAELCNKRRKDAKAADENSYTLFYSIFIEKYGPFNESSVVMGTLDKAFDVLLMHSGLTKRVYIDQLDVRQTNFVKTKGKLTLTWNRDKSCNNFSHQAPITILTTLSSIDVTVSAVSESENSAPKIKVILRNPGCCICQKSLANTAEQNQLQDISILQDKIKVVDEDRLYNILDDI